MAVSVQSYEVMSGMGDSSSTVAWSISAGKWVAAVSIFFVSTILICYGACLHQGHCGTGPWNSISHSWEHPPGSYASRFVVGTSCDMIAVFHGFLYIANKFASRQPNTDKKCCQCFTNEVLLGVGIFACFCLSWVGAICDADTDPKCMGNNTIHSACAILFFLLTDVVAGVLACDPKTEEGKKPKRRLLNMIIFIVMTSCTMVRACKFYCEVNNLGYGPQNGDNFVIIAEVIEVSFFIVFMNTLAQSIFTNMSWAVVTSTTPPEGQDMIIAITAKKIVYFGIILVMFVLISTYIIGEAENQYSTDLPLIGDMWTFKPNNWISRWSTVQATSAFIWVSIFSQLAFAHNEWSIYDSGLVILQVISLLAFAGQGIVNKSDGENKEWHDIFIMVFYLVATLFALITVSLDQVRFNRRIQTNPHYQKPSRVLQILSLLSFITVPIRYLVHDLNPTVDDALDWIIMLVLVAFYSINCVYRVATSDMALAILVQPTNEEVESKTTTSSYKNVAAIAPRSDMGISLL